MLTTKTPNMSQIDFWKRNLLSARQLLTNYLNFNSTVNFYNNY